MLLHRNQALFKHDKQSSSSGSARGVGNGNLVARNLSGSVLDYMNVDEFIQQALSACGDGDVTDEKIQQSISSSSSTMVPILSMLAGQLKGLRTLFALHSYMLSNSETTTTHTNNILDRVRETAQLILSCDDVVLIQLSNSNGESTQYVVTHSNDSKLIGTVIYNQSERSSSPAPAGSHRSNGIVASQFRSNLLRALASGAIRQDSSDQSVIHVPIHCGGEVRGYVVARCKCSNAGTAQPSTTSPLFAAARIPSIRGVDEIAMTPPAAAVGAEFSDTDNTLLQFIAVTCGIALTQLLSLSATSTAGPLSMQMNRTQLYSHQQQLSFVGTNGSNVFLEYASSVLLAKSCTNIATCKALNEMRAEVQALLRAMFSCDYIDLLEVRTQYYEKSSENDSINSRQLHIVVPT
jgi:GAF domain-containing protein